MHHFSIFRLLMMIYFSVLSSPASCYALTNEWENHWVQAIKACDEKNYLLAEREFSLAITNLESVSDFDHLHVYVDRARLLCLLDRQGEALADVNMALKFDRLSGDDLIKALLTRMHIYATLNRQEEMMNDYQLFRSVYPFPRTEFGKDHIIIRNVPECDCYKSMMTNVLVSSQLCKNASDIQWLKSGICIAKKAECDCGCKKLAYNAKADCDYWCEKGKTCSLLFCTSKFKNWRCQAACVSVVEAMSDACYWCCAQGDFYERCLKHFDNLVQRIGQGCDPAFD